MIYMDFEFNDRQVILCCTKQVFKDGKPDLTQSFDLRNGADIPRLREYVEDNLWDIWVSFALDAEITSLLRVGIDVTKLRCIDLMAECRQISMSYEGYFVPEGNLIGHLRTFLGINTQVQKEIKDKMRDLIIFQDDWDELQWSEIVKYCLNDIEYLRDLFGKVIELHKEAGHVIKLKSCLSRGEYIRMCSEMDFASKGFPVDVSSLNKIFQNKDEIKRLIIKNIPSFAIRNCFTLNKKGGFTLSRKKFNDLITANQWSWDLTDNGLPCLDSKYLEKQETSYPSVEHLRRAQKSLVTMNSADLRNQLKGNYIKPRTNSFAAKTGRNGLKPKQGYLLNLPSWMRKIIKPESGKVLIGCDWSQQEIAIAAALSKDQKMIEAYNTGDLYLALGKMAGHIPPEGTKQIYKTERDLFKALQLALGFGKGVKSLAKDFKNIMKDQQATDFESLLLAKGIFDWHKQHFGDYWRWIENEVSTARMSGWISSVDDWVCFVNSKSMRTQLLNFPSQANGASLMRETTKELYREWITGGLPEVLCSQHDAFYFNVDIDRADEVTLKVESIMSRTALRMFGIEIRASSKVYHHSTGYIPEHLTPAQNELWNSIMTL